MFEKLRKLTNPELLSQLQKLVNEERRLTTEILWHFKIVEERRLYAEQGFTSMYEFAIKHLGYSEAAAHRRISSSRLLQEMPEIEKSIQDGTLNLTTISLAQKFFRSSCLKKEEKSDLLRKLEGKTKKQVEKELVKLNPQFVQAEKTRPVSPGETELRVTLKDSLLEKLEKIKNLIGHQFPNPSWAQLIEYLPDHTIEKVDPTSAGGGTTRQTSRRTKTRTRYISRKLKIQVWKRDGGKCTYTDKISGRRCNSNYALEIDHIKPYALGGESKQENLRLLCRSHNKFLAEKIFGERRNH